jgi:hypothetical protein
LDSFLKIAEEGQKFLATSLHRKRYVWILKNIFMGYILGDTFRKIYLVTLVENSPTENECDM